jgi:WD40 repeat protein
MTALAIMLLGVDVGVHSVQSTNASDQSVSDALPPLAQLGTPLPKEKAKPDVNHELRRTFQSAVAFSPDGKTLVSGSWDHVVRLWDVETRKEKFTYQGKSKVMHLSYSPDGKTLAAAYFDDLVVLLDPATGKEQRTIRVNTNSKLNVAVFTPDGKYIVTGSWRHEDNVQVWDPATGKLVAKMNDGRVNKVWSLCFSPDGKTLVSTDANGAIRLWDMENWKEKTNFGGPPFHIYHVACMPDGKSVLTSCSFKGMIGVWDIATGKSRLAFKGHTDSVYCSIFSPNGKTLFTAGGDQTVRVWDVTSEKEKMVLKGHQHNFDMALSADGKLLATVGEDTTVLLWDVSGLTTGQRER